MKRQTMVFLAVTFGLVWWLSHSVITAVAYLAVGVAVWAAAHYLRQGGDNDNAS